MMKNVCGPVATALVIINRDISCHIILKQLARQAGTNECTLKKSFRAALNTSVYQYLLQCRMQRAAELLIHTAAKEKDIAADCGYETLAGFVTAFRKYHGRTPGAARKQYLNATVRI